MTRRWGCEILVGNTRETDFVWVIFSWGLENWVKCVWVRQRGGLRGRVCGSSSEFCAERKTNGMRDEVNQSDCATTVSLAISHLWGTSWHKLNAPRLLENPLLVRQCFSTNDFIFDVLFHLFYIDNFTWSSLLYTPQLFSCFVLYCIFPLK